MPDEDDTCASNAKKLECKVIIRGKFARSRWERFCKLLVGDPVHMDIVLAKPQSQSARLCFSSYANQEFEICVMSDEMLEDTSMVNQCLCVTEQEYEKCMQFVQGLVESKTKYDYMDAMVLMPLAPKVYPRAYPLSHDSFRLWK